MSPADSLAIVIPAYKPGFLRTALASVAAQTDRRFRLYVGDDAGPGEVADICAAYAASGEDITYHRFEANLGRTSLAAHWNRCIARTSEPWVWLFSDDDVMLPDCVAAIHAELPRAGDVDVLRFDSEVIDGQGRRLCTNPPHPQVESGADFIFERMFGRRRGYAVDHVFRRKAFDAAGGFPEYPFAWGSDYAAWFLFSRRGGIRTLRAGRVQYRETRQSISGANRRHQREKLRAHLQFLRFVEREVAAADGQQRSQEEWRRAMEHWFVGHTQYLMPVGPSLWAAILRESHRWWRRGMLSRARSLALWDARAWIALAGSELVRRARGRASSDGVFSP